MSWMHVVAQGDCVTGAHRGMSKENGNGTEGHGEKRTEEYVDRAVERQGKRTISTTLEGDNQQKT